jgi:predicted dehydrogenase
VSFAILGSGFGLYGYLPALIGCGQSVGLPERYRERFLSRLELAPFADRIEWAVDEAAALDQASGVVIAQRPADQALWIPRCLAKPNVMRLVLEKPLAPTPAEALRLQAKVASSGKSFRIGYTFCAMPWAARIAEFAAAQPKAEITIGWRFMAHHFRHDLSNWKRWSDAGGGAIRFYGIQLIAVLAQLGYREVVESRSMGASEQEIVYWSAVLAGEGLPSCRLLVDCRSEVTEFLVSARSPDRTDGPLFADRDPFGDDRRTAGPSGLDSRIGVLSDLVRPLIEHEPEPVWYNEVLTLWQRIEARTVFAKLDA